MEVALAPRRFREKMALWLTGRHSARRSADGDGSMEKARAGPGARRVLPDRREAPAARHGGAHPRHPRLLRVSEMPGLSMAVGRPGGWNRTRWNRTRWNPPGWPGLPRADRGPCRARCRPARPPAMETGPPASSTRWRRGTSSPDLPPAAAMEVGRRRHMHRAGQARGRSPESPSVACWSPKSFPTRASGRGGRLRTSPRPRPRRGHDRCDPRRRRSNQSQGCQSPATSRYEADATRTASHARSPHADRGSPSARQRP